MSDPSPLKIRSEDALRSAPLYPVGRAASSSLAPNAVPSASDPSTVGTTHEKSRICATGDRSRLPRGGVSGSCGFDLSGLYAIADRYRVVCPVSQFRFSASQGHHFPCLRRGAYRGLGGGQATTPDIPASLCHIHRHHLYKDRHRR